MKKLFCLFFCICVLLFSQPVSSIYAQSIGLSMTVGTQAVTDGNIPLNLEIKTPQDLTSVKITWILPYGLSPESGEATNYSQNITANIPFFDHFVVNPKYAGDYTVTADVSGAYQGNPYDQSSTAVLHIDNALHMSQNSGQFISNLFIYLALRLLALALFCILGKVVYDYLKARFLMWLNKED